MDLRAFDKSPKVAPLLVRLYEGQQHYDATKKDPALKADIAGAVSDLLDIPLSTREEELLTDVLISLARQAETDLRQAMAERLSTLASVPLRLVLHLVNDEIEVAAPMLKKSPILSDLDLIYIVKSQGPEYACAIAERDFLGAQVIDALVDTNDIQTAITLTENDRASLTKHALEVLSKMARSHDELAKPLLARSDVPETVARELYSHVGRELQSYIRTFYGVDGEEADAAMDDIILEFSDAPALDFMPTEQMVHAADVMASRGLLNLSMMMGALERGQIKNFIAMFAKYSGISAKRIHEFLSKACPKGMAIACRAFDMQKADFSRIYLMTNRMRSESRIVKHKDMIETLRYFDKVRPVVARRMISRFSR